jgi:Bacterial PH domain
VTHNPDIIPDGLPDHLPEGEKLLWQGRPDWKRLAIEAFHVRKVALYFAGIIALQAVLRLGATVSEAVNAVPVLALLGVLACAILTGLAWLSAKTTSYTLTSKRVLMRVGMALPVIINIPYRHVDSVSYAVTGNGHGTICFKTGGGVRLAYLLLWPHTKPWHIAKPLPALRAIADVETVASRLAFAIGGQMPANENLDALPEGGLIAAE